MGASWSQVLQGMLVGLAVQIGTSVVCILSASLWASMKERMSRSWSPPAGGENNTEPDLEMGTMNGVKVVHGTTSPTELAPV